MHGAGICPVVGEPCSGTLAHWLAPGELIARGWVEVPTRQELRWSLLEHALRKETIELEMHNERGDIFRRLTCPRSGGQNRCRPDAGHRADPLQPPLPVIGRRIGGGAAARDGLCWKG
jgi:hypothetical protein